MEFPTAGIPVSHFPVADRMQHLPSQFFASLVQTVNARVEAGHDVINLGQGNPDMPTPPHIVESLRTAALDKRTHRYSPFTGLPRLKAAAAEFYQREYGVSVHPETQIAILFGGKSGLVEVSQVFLNPQDVALVPDPGYPDYWSGIALAQANMHTVPLKRANRFLPDLDAIGRDVADAAKVMFLNYPNNPTGAVADLGFFEEVTRFAAKHQVLVVHDFAYGAIGFDGVRPTSFLQAPGAMETGIEVYTLSKTYNMAGWRVAFAVGNPSVIEAINLYQDHCYVSLFPAVQLAAADALMGDQSCVRELVATYESRRNAFMSGLREHGYDCEAPGGSFFAWLPTPGNLPSQAFARILLEEGDVAVAPGVGFGSMGEGYVRVGLLTSEERLREAARRIGEVVARLRATR